MCGPGTGESSQCPRWVPASRPGLWLFARSGKITGSPSVYLGLNYTPGSLTEAKLGDERLSGAEETTHLYQFTATLR